MEMKFNENITSALKMDNTDFLVKNLEKIRGDEGFQKSILSLSLEHGAFKCFKYLASNNFRYIYSLSYGYALREGRQDIIDIINEFNLFDIEGEQAKSLLNIVINNNDDVLFEKIKDLIKPGKDILSYALSGKNMKAIELYQCLGYKWEIDSPEKNPLIFIYEIYDSNRKNFIRLVLESKQKDEMLSFATKYFEENGEIVKFKKLLPK